MAKTTQQRRNEIYRIIVSKGSARVSELAEQLQVTTETIRKDLNSMDEQGIIIKNHGGAEIKNTYYQLPLDVKMSEHVYEKQLIARRALDFIQDNTVLFLDPGSTILYLAKYLRLRKGLTVVTNSLAIASMVSETTHQLMIAGGLLQKQGKAAIGGFTNSMIDAIHIDTAFMGCDGFLDSFGPATFSHEEMEVKQHVLRKAQQRILLCDSSKFRKSSSYTFAKWSDYDVLITDQITEQEQDMVKEVRQLICVSDEDYEFL